ncbi:unnamed protein product [Moneuplotes crassus]|uniref:Uncharacterized protein n=1 Tax=Euplotes crassus TaxID=5936 RepID=A0AAD1Y9Y9_EUPCR|nr:unnamed protein product [Moneuplotes crassus]
MEPGFGQNTFIFSDDGSNDRYHNHMSPDRGLSPLNADEKSSKRFRSRSILNFQKDKCGNSNCALNNRDTSWSRDHLNVHPNHNTGTHISCSRAYNRRHRGTLGEYLFASPTMNKTIRIPRKSPSFSATLKSTPKAKPVKSVTSLYEEVSVSTTPTIIQKKRIFGEPRIEGNMTTRASQQSFKEMMNNPYKYQSISVKLGENFQKSIHKKYTPTRKVIKQKLKASDLETHSPRYLNSTQNSSIRKYISIKKDRDGKAQSKTLAEIEAYVNEQRGIGNLKDAQNSTLKDYTRTSSKNKDLYFRSDRSPSGGSRERFHQKKIHQLFQGVLGRKITPEVDPEKNLVTEEIKISDEEAEEIQQMPKKVIRSKKKTKRNKKQIASGPELTYAEVKSKVMSIRDTSTEGSKSPSERTLDDYLQMILDKKKKKSRRKKTKRTAKSKKLKKYQENAKKSDPREHIYDDRLEWQRSQFEQELLEQERKYYEHVENLQKFEYLQNEEPSYEHIQNGGSQHFHSSAESSDYQKTPANIAQNVPGEIVLHEIKGANRENYVTFENPTEQAQQTYRNSRDFGLNLGALPKPQSPLKPRFRSKKTTKEMLLSTGGSVASIWTVPDSLKEYTDVDKRTGYNFDCEECDRDPDYNIDKRLPNYIPQ